MATKTIEEIFQQEDDQKIIADLKQGRNAPLPDVKKLRDEFYVTGHAVFDKTDRPEREVLNDAGELLRLEKVNRLAFPFQKKIVNASAAFAFGSPVKINCETKTDQEAIVVEAIKRILFDNKINSFNRRMAKDLMRATEVGEVWFPVPTAEVHEDYGFPCKFRIRVKQLSIWEGETFYPYFDASDDMVAFSRSYKVQEGSERVQYFECYTPNKRYVFRENTERQEFKIEIGKIPVIYGQQEESEWNDVQGAIERLEKLLSNFAETNDYHAAPKIFVEGEVKGFAKKGESGGIIEGEPGTKAYYLSWNNAPESVKLEIETLIRFIYTFTQTPDVSFDSVKGLSAISGVALEMLFLDAKLKVKDKREIFDAYLQRRINIIKAFVGKLNTSLSAVCQKLIVEPEIVPFAVKDEKSEIEKLLLANGQKPILSQKTTVQISGLTPDPDTEWDQIEKETEEESKRSVFEPTE